MKRNLIYHVMPYGQYRWNIDQLLQRWDVFDGQKFIGIVTGQEMDDPDDVRRMFPGNNVTFAVYPNDRQRGEAVTFNPIMRTLCGWPFEKPYEQATFYAHTKGATRGEDEAIRLWTEAMYHHNLDRVGEAMELLQSHVMVGAFKRYGKFEVLGPTVDWHYHGSFFWFRNYRVWAGPIHQAQEHRHGVEAFPGEVCVSQDAACIFADGLTETSMYNLDYARAILGPKDGAVLGRASRGG